MKQESNTSLRKKRNEIREGKTFLESPVPCVGIKKFPLLSLNS